MCNALELGEVDLLQLRQYNHAVQYETTAIFPKPVACLTLDLEADHHDLVSDRHVQALADGATWQWLLDFSQARSLPWSVFVVGELLDRQPWLADRLADSGWELGLHSYSHDPARADALDEIQRGKRAFRSAFGRDPEGYRAPLGRITQAGIQRLQAENFCYDASVFPTWHPGKANHLTWPQQPYLVDPGDGGTGRSPLVEIPFAVVPHLRLIVSVSFIKLLGIRTYRLLLNRLGLPWVAVIDCHMHDLAPAPAAYRQLSPFWKLIYRRNRGLGRTALVWLVDWLSRAGYEFRTVGAVASHIQESVRHD